MAVSVLEDVCDEVWSCQLIPGLLLLRSLVELGRLSDAIEFSLKAIAKWKHLDQLVDVQAGCQMAQILLFASIAAVGCKQYELAHLLTIR